MVVLLFNVVNPLTFKPKYKYPPVIFMILDDLIGSIECFRKGNSLISNLMIKHRHLGINLIFPVEGYRARVAARQAAARSVAAG